MKNVMKKWEVKSELKAKNEKLKTAELIDLLLTNRGIGKKELDSFLEPKLETVTVESVGIDRKQLQKTLGRIEQALKTKEQIVIFGDYDVDGITGTAILWETLHDMGASVMPYIPHRVDEGYGLSLKGIANAKEQLPDTRLIITVDNGIVANDAVDFAKTLGIDVIITDHHVPSEKLPGAYSFVHTTKLCGAGVAWLLSQQIKEQIAKKSYAYKDDVHLELVALATIADLVPLTGANRVLVSFGLRKLARTKREGLLALFLDAACDPKTVGVYQVGHSIAPRLNASGRLASAMDALRLVCTKDKKRAAFLASQLGSVNRERQLVMQHAAEHATLSVKAKKELKKLLVVSHESYQEGVIGLVAGRLVEEYYRPSIVISRGENVSKGSVRSISGFNIIEFLRSSSEYLVNVGGHPMAAGFTIETKKIESFQKKLEELADSIITDETLTRSLRIDCELPLSFIDQALFKNLQALAPFGMGNPEPVFATKNVVIHDLRTMGKENTHLKLLLSDGGIPIEAVAFGMGEWIKKLKKQNKIDVAYTIDMNSWNGRETLQLKIKDLKSQ